MEARVNKSEWDQISDQDRQTIERIVHSHFPRAKVTPDANIKSSIDTIKVRELSLNISKPWCSAACDVAEAAAVAACADLSGPASPLCIAASHAAGNICRSKC